MSLIGIGQLFAQTYTARLPYYSPTSKLATGKWVKIGVSENGVYKITFEKLRSLGFSDPSKVRVYGYGGWLLSELLNSNYNDDLPEVNSYLGDSYILFYGVGAAKLIKHNGDNPFKVEKNPYADKGYYFLSDVEGVRREVELSPAVTEDADVVKRTHYAVGCYMPEKVNPHKRGKTFYDVAIVKEGNKNVSFPYDYMVEGNNGFLSVEFFVDGLGANDSYSCTVSTPTQTFKPGGSIFTVSNVYQSSTNSGLDFSLEFKTPNSLGAFYLYKVTSTALCYNKLYAGYLNFNNLNDDNIGYVNEFVVSNVTASTQVWNVTDPLNVSKMTTMLDGDSLRFKAVTSTFSEFIAFNPNSTEFCTVDSYSEVNNQDLHAFNGADLVIISPDKYKEQAQRLADAHSYYEGISCYVLNQDMIFNEFSSGTPDPTAIRSFLKMMYDRGVNDSKYVAPRYLLLFGDGSYDNRGVSKPVGSVDHNLVMTYQYSNGANSYVADDYYGMLEDNLKGSFSIINSTYNVAVGRLPFTTAAEANGVVDKLVNYMKNDQFGNWKNKAMLIADDNEASNNGNPSFSSYHEFLLLSEKLANIIHSNSPSVVIKKLYHDSYQRVAESSGNRYLDVERLIFDNANEGTFFINYIGHSNTVNWAAEKTFTQSQVSALSNKKLGIWFAASCEFSEYDSYSTSCGESLVLSPNGGALAVVASPLKVYANQSDEVNRNFINALYSRPENGTLGDAIITAKNAVKMEIRVMYPLLGDPAIRLVMPQPSMNVVTDKISSDTIRALSRVSVSGHVESDSLLMSSFNGKVNITVYDKEQVCKTKGNVNNYVADYNDYTTVLYSGETEVVNGKFSYEFIVPSGIASDYGNGHIVYYAYDVADTIDALGYYNDFVVGGLLDTVFADTIGPKIELYMNSTAFASGDKVGSSPVVVAYVADENGINSTGVGIGHDITVSLNGADKVSVNEYFSYALQSCTDGKVCYPLNDLADGYYTLTFKAWDMLNNSSSKTISFKVENGRGSHINSMIASPNPAVSQTEISVFHDRPMSDVEYKVAIFDLQGRGVAEMSGVENSKDGKLSLFWNLKDKNGVMVEPGVYLYRVDIKASGESFEGKTEKIVVLPQ